MCLEMLVEVGKLRKGLLAARLTADVGLLVRVNAQVVVEVVPLPESL